MRKLTIAAVVLGVLGFAAGSASAATYYVARAHSHEAKISFRVKHGVVDAGFTQTKDVDCNGKLHFDTVSAAFDDAVVSNGRFNSSDTGPRIHKVLAGQLDGDSARGRTRIKTREGCDTGQIRWTAKRVAKARWEAFNSPHFHP